MCGHTQCTGLRQLYELEQLRGLRKFWAAVQKLPGLSRTVVRESTGQQCGTVGQYSSSVLSVELQGGRLGRLSKMWKIQFSSERVLHRKVMSEPRAKSREQWINLIVRSEIHHNKNIITRHCEKKLHFLFLCLVLSRD